MSTETVHWLPWSDRFARCGMRLGAKLQAKTRDARLITCEACKLLHAAWQKECITQKDGIHDRVYLRIHGR